jgi:ABC-2 type transport system permease protein
MSTITPTPLRRQPLATQFLDLLLIELTNWRWSWRLTLVTGAVAPLISILALGVFARDAGAEALAYVLTGNLVMSLLFGTMNNLESHFGYLRLGGMLDYFATLPLRRGVLLAAVVTAFLLLALPGLLITLLAGAAVLGVPLSLHPAALLALPLCALPLAGIGALVGMKVRNPMDGGPICLLVTVALLALGPVMVPPSRLPAALQIVGWASPATYAASALRLTLLGPVTSRLFLDLAVLALLAAIMMAAVARQLGRGAVGD